jgi:hypothetical protein
MWHHNQEDYNLNPNYRENLKSSLEQGKWKQVFFQECPGDMMFVT